MERVPMIEVPQVIADEVNDVEVQPPLVTYP
jgi:hypothetical protein